MIFRLKNRRNMLRIVDAHTLCWAKIHTHRIRFRQQTISFVRSFVWKKKRTTTKKRKRWRWIRTPGFVHCDRDKRCSDVICIRKQINQRRTQMRTQQPVKLGELCRPSESTDLLLFRRFSYRQYTAIIILRIDYGFFL